MKQVDFAFSVKVAGLIGAQQYHCWYNARDALLQLPGLLFFAAYVEGWLVMPKEQEVLVVEHGWIECRNERIVDPTIVLIETEEQPLYYFAGLRLFWAQVQQLPQDTPLPLASLTPQKDGIGTLVYPEYQAAYENALQHAQQLAQPSDKPVHLCPRETIRVEQLDTGMIIITFEA